MQRIIIKRLKNYDEEHSFWMSYSDLMASILIIFILLFIYKILDYQTGLERKEKVIQDLTNTRLKIIALLQKEFEKEHLSIEIDPRTGAIKLSESVLFDYGKSELKPEGKVFLNKFIPIYLRILLGNPEIKKEIAQIIVEGYTDNKGDYIFNLNLSQERAFSVVKYLFDDHFNYPYKNELKNYITANGRSYINLIYNPDGTINAQKSRRVEFQFRLNEEKTILKIKKELEEGIE